MTLQSQQLATDELQELQSFLEANRLPYKDIKLAGNLFIRYNDADGNLIGSGGLELYGKVALIRSVAVIQSRRRENLGTRIVDDLLQRARGLQIDSVYLLTETAHSFFLKKGFKDFDRDEVPAELKNSSEFSEVCPASAKCMLYTFNE